MLRLEDLLDIDNGRFNTASKVASGGLPKSSVSHKEKHEATTHLLVTPERIEFSSDCPNQEAYLETRKFLKLLEEELTFCTMNWSDIAPITLGGYVPKLRKKELLLNGVPDINGINELCFDISQEKAFSIIEGSNIYQDRFLFIREVIQNALDASKIQLWRDLRSGLYSAWLKKKEFKKELKFLQPYDLISEIYENYPINVTLSTLSDGTTQVEVSDNGTGISIEAFKRMCKVGENINDSDLLQQTIEEMPRWLRPTAGFGVDLQSIFLVTDYFEIDTNTGADSFHAVFPSIKNGGHVLLQRLQRGEGNLHRGTTVRIRFR